MNETCRPIPGYEGRYEVSDLGNVKSLRRDGGLLKPNRDGQGYPTVNLQGTRIRVHELVMRTFVGPKPAGSFIRRRDGDKTNPALANLYYAQPQPTSLEELLARGVASDGDCLVWPGPCDSNGYGLIRWEGMKVRVHRLVAHLVHGLDLADTYQYARHECDNPPCFNPDHITPGTPRDNQQDAIRRARRIRTHCKRGHRFDADNVIYEKHSRKCRTCDAARKRAWETRKRSAS